MALPAQLPSKLLCLFLVACHTAAKPGMLDSALAEGQKTHGGITYINNVPYSGTLFSLYPGTRDTMYTKNYLDGREDGVWKQFYPGGKLAEIRYFKQGKKEGVYTAYWENSTKKLEYYFRDGEYHGCCKEWNIHGALCKEMNYRNGYEDGTQKVWYDNGSIKSNYVIRNGRRYGLLGTMNCKNVSDSIFNP